MKNFEVREDGGQYIGTFNVKNAPNQFIKSLIIEAEESGEATAVDENGCMVTACEA